LNNDHNLIHGGRPHLDAVNRAGGKLPDDPTLDSRAFPGFVLFPQCLNNWNGGQIEDVLRLVYLLINDPTINIDLNRIYVHGLSLGAENIITALKRDPSLFACAALMSPSNSDTKVRNDTTISNVPLWVFQGGRDSNPSPNMTQNLKKWFEELGGSVRYTLYPNLGHGTWNTAYAEPDFFTWFLENRRNNLLVYYGDSTLCSTNNKGVKLGMPHNNRYVTGGGTPANNVYDIDAYQWEKDGVILTGETKSIYFATEPGIYRGRFSRVPNPSESDWNEWSAPVKITESNPVTPVITSVGSRHIPDINGKDSVELKTDFGSKLYYNWFNNSTKLNIPDSVFSIVVNSSGNYSVQNTTFGGCSSLESQPVTVTVNAPQTINAPDILSLKDLGDGKVQIYWRDNSLNETGFEIYRSTNPVGPYDFVALTNEDQVSIQDSGLTSTTTYYYTMRAVGNSAVSPYSGNVSFSTGNDTVAPTAPTLSMVNYDLTQVDLRWEGATDNTGIKEYHLQYGSTIIKIGSEFNSYTVTGILANFTYNFTIKAVDFADNESVASNQVVISTVTTGLRYEHSTGAWDDLDEIDFSNPEFTGYVDNITLDPRTQEDYFNMKFDGYLYINTADNYRFYLASDDGSRLKIDGNTIVDNDGLHGVVEKDATTYLSSGPHAVQVLFFEKTGGQALTLMYRGADIGNKKTIPNSAWRSGDPIILSPPTSPTSLQASAINSTEIDLTWNHNGKLPDDFSVVILGSSTAEGVGASTYSASWAGQFESWLGSRSTNSSVTNLAMGGFTTEDVRPDGSSPAPDITRNITKAVSLRPDLIIINLPSNNVQENIDAQTTMNHYREIKAKTDAAGIYLLVTSTQPRNTDAAKRLLLQVERDSLLNYFSDNVIDIYEELTNFTNLSIKTMYSAGDGIHLNDAGHAYIFSEVQNKVNQKFVNYEVHRSIDNSNYQLIGNSGVPTFSDLNLIPSTKYFYKVRAVNNNGTSGFSNSASATTLEDNISPTVPQGLEVITTTYTNVGLSWLASTDDSKVSKYYIYIDGVLTDSSTTISYYTSNLEPSSSYEVAVSAVDFSGNESGLSSVVTINTTSPSVFYSKASGFINAISSWGTNADGSGVSPTDFTYNGQYFVLKNRSNFDLSSNWNVSGLITKVIVDQNVTFDVNQPIDVLIDVHNGAILNLNSDFNIKLDSVFSGSTINFSAVTQIPARSYGNLIVSGTGLKTLNGNKAIVGGDISILDGAGIKGKSANSSTIELYGNMTNQGSTLFPSNDNLVGLSIKGLNSTINYSGLLNLYKLDILPNAQVQLNSGNPAPKINIGTLNGGGVIGGNGSKLLIGNGTLEIKDFGEFNSGNSNLILNVNGGSIIYNSRSSASSYLRFDAAGKSLKNFDLNTLSGNVFIESPLEVTNAIKIKNGNLHAQGNLTLVSNSTHTTSVKSLEGNGQILGIVNAQRYLSNKGAIWRYLSTPVSGISVADWQTSIPITGNFSGSSPQSIYPSLYYYDEPNGGWIIYPEEGGSNSALL
ncbi:MAG: PA14 domain-containing protein, partial [Cyclobacteriaceae bacterium]|nr:PA14 domain-containing protein [Cyclobacteriaceae bacterium]